MRPVARGSRYVFVENLFSSFSFCLEPVNHCLAVVLEVAFELRLVYINGEITESTVDIGLSLITSTRNTESAQLVVQQTGARLLKTSSGSRN